MTTKVYINSKRVGLFQRLKYRLFNISYNPTDLYILNNNGEKFYYSYTAPAGDIWFFHKEQSVGNIKLVWSDKSIEIADIVVFPLGTGPKRDFRNQGLGSAMFSLVQEIAFANGIEEICGKMQPENPSNLVEWERLRNFYRKQGCTIEGKVFRFEVKRKSAD